MFKKIMLKNSISHFYQHLSYAFEKSFHLRRNNYSLIFLKIITAQFNYVSQNLKYFGQSKMYSQNFHSNVNYRNNLPKFSKPIITDQRPEKWGGAEAFNTIIFIRENYKEIIQNNPSVLVFFSAEWCKHCQQLKEIYGKASLMALKANLPIKFAFFDVNIKPEIAEENGVVGVPIIKYYRNGKFISNYKGKRTIDGIYEFAKNPPTTFVDSTEADF